MQPDDQSKRIKERERGELARRIFDNPLWREGYEKLAEDLLNTMIAPTTEDEKTLECKRQLLALHDVKRRLQTILETGQMAQKQLNEARDGTEQRRRRAG